MKRLFTALTLLIFTTHLAGAEPIDPACSQQGGGALKVLKSCEKLYCKPAVKMENTRDNIKFIDETLDTYNRHNEGLTEAVKDYVNGCRALLKKFCETCPQMDTVHNAVLRVQLSAAEAKESADILNLHENFLQFGVVVSRDEGDLACSSQVVALSKRASELHVSAIRRFRDTTCDKQ